MKTKMPAFEFTPCPDRVILRGLVDGESNFLIDDFVNIGQASSNKSEAESLEPSTSSNKMISDITIENLLTGDKEAQAANSEVAFSKSDHVATKSSVATSSVLTESTEGPVTTPCHAVISPGLAATKSGIDTAPADLTAVAPDLAAILSGQGMSAMVSRDVSINSANIPVRTVTVPSNAPSMSTESGTRSGSDQAVNIITDGL